MKICEKELDKIFDEIKKSRAINNSKDSSKKLKFTEYLWIFFEFYFRVY